MLALASYAFRFPVKIAVNGHAGDAFTISAVLAFVVMVFGMLLIRRAPQ